ncbi:MAG: hypothetical protein ACRCV9_18075 [Burkholderiaceae bacterium]
MKLILAGIAATFSLLSFSLPAQERAGVQVTLADYGPVFAKRMAEPLADDDAKYAAWATQSEAAALLAKQLGEAELKAKVLAAWPKYAGAAEQLGKGFNGLAPSPVDAMNSINSALNFNKSLKMNFVAYAGLFDGKVVSTIQDGVASLYIPVEQGGAAVSPAIAREYARIAVQRMAISLGDRNLAEVAVHEGLALHLAKSAVPGSTEDSFVDPAWLTKARSSQNAIFAAVKPQLATTGADVISKFTTGSGATGVNGEAIYAGKLVVERWLRQGLTIREILNTPRADMARSVGRVMDAIGKR